MNSVLHHLLNLEEFATECKRVLKKDGLLIIAHEPNGRSALSGRSRLLAAATKLLFEPTFVIFEAVKKSSLLEKTLRAILSKVSSDYRTRNAMLENIADDLIEEGLIDQRLRGTEIQQLVDIQTEKGFGKTEIADGVFSEFELLECSTHNFLGPLQHKNRLTQSVCDYLEKHNPESGENITFIFRTNH